MTDVHDAETRRYNMSRIRGQDTKPELIVRRLCHSLGLRFRLHDKSLPGKPDLVFRKYSKVIQVNGCFWHSHSCRYGAVKPSKNAVFWIGKRNATVERDKRNERQLRERGWDVLTIWECECKDLPALREEICKAFDL